MKQAVSIITMENNCTVSEFSKKFGITRGKVYQLISDRKLSGIIVSEVFYPDFSDEKYIRSLISHDRQGMWSRNRGREQPYRMRDEHDEQFQRDWEEMCL